MSYTPPKPPAACPDPVTLAPSNVQQGRATVSRTYRVWPKCPRHGADMVVAVAEFRGPHPKDTYLHCPHDPMLWKGF